eukprot:4333694-Pleurochrysis_carterae.AAC.5
MRIRRTPQESRLLPTCVSRAYTRRLAGDKHFAAVRFEGASVVTFQCGSLARIHRMCTCASRYEDVIDHRLCRGRMPATTPLKLRSLGSKWACQFRNPRSERACDVSCVSGVS